VNRLSAALIVLCTAAPVSAQFDFGAPGLVKGRVTVSATDETTEYGLNDQGQRVARIRSRSRVTTSSELLLQLVITDLDAQLQVLAASKKKLGKLGHTSSFVYGNNFSATMGKGQVAQQDPAPPRSPVSGRSESSTWLPRLCDSSAALTESQQETIEANAKEALLTVELVPDLDSLQQLRACVTIGWGIDRSASGKITTRELELDPGQSECATRWKTLPDAASIGAPLIALDDCLGAIGVDQSRRDGDATIEVHYPRIPAAEFAAFLKDPTKAKVFTLPFSSKRVEPNATRTIEGTMTLTLGVPVEGKVEIFPADESLYSKWLPVPDDEPGARAMVVVARVNAEKGGKDDFLDFSLTDVTEYPGSWGNSPDSVKNQFGPDLAIAPQARQLDPNVSVFDDSSAQTTKKVKEAKIVLEVRDYAAFGVVRVRAREQHLDATSRADGSAGLPVPRDRELNKIGDAWEEEHKTVQLDLAWDQEEVKGRKAKGDNLSYLEEYRGFKVKGKTDEEHRRLSPVKQEIFVCDPENVAHEDLWEKATAIQMIKVSNKHLLRPRPKDEQDANEWRTVDTRGDKNKRAIYIRYTRSKDPDYDPDNSGPCVYRNGWASHLGYASDCDGMVHLFEARFRVPFENQREWFDLAMAGEAWPLEGLTNVAAAHRMSLNDLKVLAKKKAASFKGEADLGSLTREQTAYIALHEIGHRCRVVGHSRPPLAEGKPPRDESTEGDAVCPMRYEPMEERLELLIFGAKKPVAPLRGRGLFCSAAPDNCFGALDAKNQ